MPATWDDLIAKASVLIEDGGVDSNLVAAEKVVSEYPSLVAIAAATHIRERLQKRYRKQWFWGREHPQLTLDIGEEHLSVPDEKVRYLDAERKERFKPRRFSTFDQSRDSKEVGIRRHVQAVARKEREITQENQTEARLFELGRDTKQIWDAIRHKDTLCDRCGKGYDPDNPFTKGHTTPAVNGGAGGGWEHLQCGLDGGVSEVPVDKDVPADDFDEDLEDGYEDGNPDDD